MASEQNTSWCQSVGAVILREGKVLLARHTYGSGKNLLIIPGGYLHMGELPEDAVQREVMEETGVSVKAVSLLAARFNVKDWYMIFLAEYIGGEARSDGDENSEVLWIPCEEALQRDDVPDLTKKAISAVLSGKTPLEHVSYDHRGGQAVSLYTLKQEV